MSDETTEVAVPFANAQEHLESQYRRIRLMVQRYMRRFSDRFLQANGSYSDLCVGPQELRRLAGLEASEDGHKWLDRHGIYEDSEIEVRLAAEQASIEARLAATAEQNATVALPLEELRAGFMLSDTEMDLLLCAAAPRLSIDMARLYTVAWADYSVRQPTSGFVSQLASDLAAGSEEVLRLLSNHSSLVRYRLLIPGEHDLWRPRTPRIHAPLEVPQEILDFMSGTRIGVTGNAGCELHQEGLATEELVIDESVRNTLHSLFRRPRPRVCLVGPVASGRRTLACSFASRIGSAVLEVDFCRALAGATATTMVIRLAELLREARLHHSVLFLRIDELGESPLKELIHAHAPAVQGLLRNYPGTVFIAASVGGKLVRLLIGEVTEIQLQAPGIPGQRNLWRRALRGSMNAKRVERLSDELSRSYRLPPGSIFRAVNAAVDQLDAGRKTKGLETSSLLRMVRRQFDHGLGWLADAISVNMGIEDVVLSDDMRSQLEEVLVYARNSDTVFHGWRFADRSPTGHGLSVMFSGPPGTGKTLMAGVVARELGRVMYRVDLSRIVDKYIGETEKNLGKVFDEAERAQAVLLFDEADSLFAQRTKVKSSNDRYANLEVNYLLQRLDAFEGVSILTSNFATNIDEAFQRRIRFKIEFPLPTAELRVRLWKTLMPPKAPISTEIDWVKLADMYEFSGGHIRNAVLRAAVHAAEHGTAITEDLLQDAGTAESREMGQLVRS